MIRSSRDVIHGCIAEIDKLCNAVYEEKPKHFLTLSSRLPKIKPLKIGLMMAIGCRSRHFVQDQRQVQKIYDVFPILGTMYDGKEYPEKLLIILGIIERLEGKEQQTNI
jgi:hypothetical protein